MAASRGGHTQPPVADALRADVRLLTTLLGDAIRAHGGPDLFTRVETLRRASIRHHAHPTPARTAAVERAVAAIPPTDALAVARAFTAFFQLVNVAEDRQRVRELRAGGAAQWHTPGPIGRSVEVTEVLTAHPTEAKRRAVVEHLWRIGDVLDALDDPRCAGRTRAEALRRLAEEVMSLWLTDPVRRAAPTPLDEVRATMALFDRTIFTTLPRVARTAGENVRFRWATWVGGDRDGNPAVTAAVTVEAARIAKEHVLRGYETATRRIARSMSASDLDVPASPAVRRALARDARAFPTRARELERTLADAPHRRRLVLMAERLHATREEGSGGYRSATEYSADVDAVRASFARAARTRSPTASSRTSLAKSRPSGSTSRRSRCASMPM